LGPDAIFDHNDPTCGEQIRAFTNDSLFLAVDNITTKESLATVTAALSSHEPTADDWTPEGKKVISVLLFVDPTWTPIETRMVLSFTSIGESFDFFFGSHYPASKKDYEFTREFWKVSEKLFAEGKLKVHRVDSRTGGLSGALSGLEDLKQGKVSGYKVVYEL
jgi:hypothetical protein